MGSYESLIDAKNRYAVPAKFRDDLGGRCVLTRGLDSCLIIYPEKTWEEQQKKLAALPSSDKQVRAYLRYIYSNAVECEIDKQGRMVLSEKFRSIAGIEKDVVSIGMLDRIELWAKEVYDDAENGAQLSPDDLEKFSENYKV